MNKRTWRQTRQSGNTPEDVYCVLFLGFSRDLPRRIQREEGGNTEPFKKGKKGYLFCDCFFRVINNKQMVWRWSTFSSSLFFALVYLGIFPSVYSRNQWDKTRWLWRLLFFPLFLFVFLFFRVGSAAWIEPSAAKWSPPPFVFFQLISPPTPPRILNLQGNQP